MLLRNYAVDVLSEAAERIYEDTGSAVKVAYVRTSLYRSILSEMPGCGIEEPIGNHRLSFHASYGYFDIAIDNDIPEGIDYYFDNDKWLWLDQIAEDILLKGL